MMNKMAILSDFITRGITDEDTLRDAIVVLILTNNNDGSPAYPKLRRGDANNAIRRLFTNSDWLQWRCDTGLWYAIIDVLNGNR